MSLYCGRSRLNEYNLNFVYFWSNGISQFVKRNKYVSRTKAFNRCIVKHFLSKTISYELTKTYN